MNYYESSDAFEEDRSCDCSMGRFLAGAFVLVIFVVLIMSAGCNKNKELPQDSIPASMDPLSRAELLGRQAEEHVRFVVSRPDHGLTEMLLMRLGMAQSGLVEQQLEFEGLRNRLDKVQRERKELEKLNAALGGDLQATKQELQDERALWMSFKLRQLERRLVVIGVGLVAAWLAIGFWASSTPLAIGRTIINAMPLANLFAARRERRVTTE